MPARRRRPGRVDRRRRVPARRPTAVVVADRRESSSSLVLSAASRHLDRRQPDGCSGRRLSHKPIRKPVRQSVVGQHWSDRLGMSFTVGGRRPTDRNLPPPSHRCQCNLISPIYATASVGSSAPRERGSMATSLARGRNGAASATTLLKPPLRAEAGCRRAARSYRDQPPIRWYSAATRPRAPDRRPVRRRSPRAGLVFRMRPAAERPHDHPAVREDEGPLRGWPGPLMFHTASTARRGLGRRCMRRPDVAADRRRDATDHDGVLRNGD